MQKFLSTRFSIVSRSKGYSAVDKASYISREQLYSEYDGRTYIPTKPNEDLVHSEINLPDNAPRGYSDRATLWNAVEMVEYSGLRVPPIRDRIPANRAMIPLCFQ